MKMLERTRTLALCLLTGGSALVGIFHVEGQALRTREGAVLPAVEVANAQATEHAPTMAVAPTAVVPTAAVAEPSGPEVVEAVPANVRVPNLVGLRLTDAANRAERRGLKVIAVDEYGEEVDLVYSRFYRVLRQSVRRGASVVPGHVIEIKVRDRTASYSDWG
jgi:hypothetical protein